MKPPLYVRDPTPAEQDALCAGLRHRQAFRVRRCQIVLASAAKQTPAGIAANLGCARQTVRNVIHAVNQRGLACLEPGSTVPLRVEPVLTADKREHLRALLHQSPRSFGHATSRWTLHRLATVCYDQGLSDWVLSAPTLLDAIRRLGVRWKRAKRWLVSPDPAYARKKTARSVDPLGGKPAGHSRRVSR